MCDQILIIYFTEYYGARGDMVSLSGISSGAYMSVQMHVTYSSSIMGVGVVAGGEML